MKKRFLSRICICCIAAISFVISSISVGASTKTDNEVFKHLKNEDTDFEFQYTEGSPLEYLKKVSEKNGYTKLNLKYLECRQYGPLVYATIEYRTSKEQENLVDNELRRAYNSIITEGMSDYQKIKAINKYIVDNFSYDETAESNNAFTAITTRKTACQGYAMMACKLFDMADIENKVISGDLNGTLHVWNLVKLNGKWYHVDITNDDSNFGNEAFLLKSDETMKKYGFSWDEDKYPVINECYGNNLGQWCKEGNLWYYKLSIGTYATGWNKIDGKWYYFNSTGLMQTGWTSIDKTWYYLYDTGEMAHDCSIGNYKLDSDGKLIL